MDWLRHDLRHALRALRRQPGFTAVALATLALGIGANTAIFSVVNGVLLRPLPFERESRLAMVWNTWHEGRFPVSERELRRYRGEDSFEEVGGYRFDAENLGGRDGAERVRVAWVTPGALSVLGVLPARGRLFAAVEESSPSEAVLLSDGLWKRRFASDFDVVGRTIRLSDRQRTVVGVLPAGFRLPLDFRGSGADLLLPLVLAAEPDPDNIHYLHAVARLAPGVPIDGARARLATVAEGLKREIVNPEGDSKLPDTFSATLVPLREQVTGDSRAVLTVLLAAVGLVLAVACVNVANLLLARSEGRRRELALRSALGAGRARLVRQMLTESLILSTGGGLLGLALATWAIPVLLRLSPADLPRAGDIGLDGRVLAFTAGVTLLTSLLFGLLPALRASAIDPRGSLQEGATAVAGGGARRSRVRRSLIVAEVSFAVMLTIGAGLMARSFWRLVAVDAGFRSEGLLTLRVNLPSSRYPDRASARRFYAEALQGLRSLPGVTDAAAVSGLPLASDAYDWGIHVEGMPSDTPGRSIAHPDWQIVTDDYFRAMGIPLQEGRGFESTDRPEAEPVIVINESLARQLWQDRSPLGARIRMTTDLDGVWRRVVGVAADVRHRGLETTARPAIFLPQSQFPASRETVFGNFTLVVRSSGDPGLLAGASRAVLARVDPEVPASDVRTMAQVLDAASSLPRMQALLFAAFSAMALGLVVVGIHGVLAYGVMQRRRELGVRMALGARAADVIRLVVGEGLRLTAAGVAAGLVLAIALSRLLAGLLFGVSPHDPLTFLAVPGVLAVAALLATYVPARRAASIDPAVTLRHD